MEHITEESFEDWKYHPVTKKLMKRMLEEREQMKEGVINNIYDNLEEVRGRCVAISNLLNLEYEDLFDNGK